MHTDSTNGVGTALGGRRRAVLTLGVSAALMAGGIVAVASTSTASPMSPSAVARLTGVTPSVGAGKTLDTNPTLKHRAAQITSSFENSTLVLQYDYAEDIGDGNGITAGRAGFCSGTHDLLLVVRRYTQLKPGNILAKYIPKLTKVDGTSSTKGLERFPAEWKKANSDALLRKVQDEMVDKLYFNPAMKQAKSVGLTTALGQAIMWDTFIQHGDGTNIGTLQIIKETRNAVGNASGNEAAWLKKFLDIRYKKMLQMYDASEKPTSQSRIAAWKSLVNGGKFQLQTPMTWKAYGDVFTIKR